MGWIMMLHNSFPFEVIINHWLGGVAIEVDDDYEGGDDDVDGDDGDDDDDDYSKEQVMEPEAAKRLSMAYKWVLIENYS